MLSWLLPKETNFFNIFEQYARVLVEAAATLNELVNNERDLVDTTATIKDLDRKGGDISHKCLDELHTVFVTPIDRDVMYKLMTHLDEILDYIDTVSTRLSIYKLNTVTPELKILVKILYRGTILIQDGMMQLRELSRPKHLQETCLKIHQIEYEGDTQLSIILGELFEKENDIKLLIKWKEIYETLEEAIDSCEEVANVIEGIILEHV